MDCLFCQIIAKEIPADFLYEDDTVVAFRDINPVAPLHALIVPKRHIATLNDLEASDAACIGHIFVVAAQLAAEAGIAADGYRTVFNCNAAAGQTVFHIHCHLLGGRILDWPPG